MENFKPHIKFSHLEKGFKPITTCIDTTEFMDEFSSFPFKDLEQKSPNEVDDIDYSEGTNNLDKKNILNGGYQTYVISDLSSKDKYSTGMYDCTGIVLVGEDTETNKNISILSHQDPKEFLKSNISISFKNHLILSLEKIVKQSKKGSIDALIVGGNTHDHEDDPALSYGEKKYLNSIKFVGEIIRDKLGFDPTVITGPKGTSGGNNVYFDTKNRRLYLSIPDQTNNVTYHDFKSENVTEQLKKIKEHESRL